MPLQIRPEQPADAAAIGAVTQAAFAQAEHASGTEAQIIAALRAAGALSVSLVAVEGEALLGHVAVSPVQISDGTPGWYGLGPLAVLPARQGQGIGSQLMHAALDALRALGAQGCVLLGEPEYYGRFGFRAQATLQFLAAPAPYFQALRFAGPWPLGTVRYHPAFDRAA